MKKLLILSIAIVAMVSAKAQTAEDVINKYLAAAGGKQKLEAINSLQYTQTMSLNTPMGAMDITMTQIRVDKKLFRINTSSEIFGSAFSVVTDTSGWIYIPANPFAGTSEATLQKMKPEERKGFSSMMACDGFFPELVNYAAKGYTAELAGEAKSGGKACYKIKLKKDKGELVYLVDKQTGFVNSMTVKGSAAAALTGMGSSGMEGGRADKMEVTFEYSNYQDVNGVKFPGKMKLDTPMGTMESVISGIKVNQVVDAKWYKPQ